VKQVTAAVIIEDGRLLLARRLSTDPLAGLWELPGGKTEPNETPQECLKRELVEELNMTADVGAVLAQTVHHYAHGSFELLALETHRRSDFELRVHDEFAWVDREEISDYELAPADVELVAQLLSGGMWAR